VESSSTRIIADKYEVIGVLGRGGTGVVYEALTKEKKAVALKVMHDELAGDKQVRGRFQREAAILRRLEGPHVCPILDSGEVPSEEPGKTLIYIALPKIEGESLADVLARGLLDVGTALDVMKGILSALASAHAQGVIHRDLKPANVLLQKSKHVIVVDFGMSKIVTGAGMGTTNLTTHNMVFGTPEYMAPEQARGDDLDQRCDVYAAGAILYEMLVGAPPFTGDTPLNVLTAHLTSDLVPPSGHAKASGRVTPALEAVVLHALARDPKDRYTSATAFAAALAHAQLAPEDLDALTPDSLAEAPASNSAFAETLPGTVVGDADVDANAATLLGSERIPIASAPPKAAPSKPPSRAPSKAPSRSAPPRRSIEEPATNRVWVLAWVVVSLASIGAGIYFAMTR
jgi:serine/threonine-protein kinase